MTNTNFEENLTRQSLEWFMAILLKQLEVVFDTTFTDWIVENVLCKMFRALSNNDSTKKGQLWCDTLLLGEQLYKFKSNFILVLSPSGKTEEVEGDVIVNCFPYGDQLLTMGELVLELEDCRA
jgi:hypothetical protein